MKLYELSHNYQNLLELMDNEDIPQDEITKALNGLEGEFNLKAENIAKLMKSMEADTKGLKDEEKRLSNRRKTLENRVISLKAYLSDSMKAIGKDKIKGDIFTLSFGKCPPSAYISDIALIGKRYFNKQEPILDKKMVLAELKYGIEIPGAELKQESSLRIK